MNRLREKTNLSYNGAGKREGYTRRSHLEGRTALKRKSSHSMPLMPNNRATVIDVHPRNEVIHAENYWHASAGSLAHWCFSGSAAARRLGGLVRSKSGTQRPLAVADIAQPNLGFDVTEMTFQRRTGRAWRRLCRALTGSLGASGTRTRSQSVGGASGCW